MMYMWKCAECSFSIEIQRPMADSAVPPDSDVKCTCTPSSWEGGHETPPFWQRVYQAPMMMTASMPDGTKRRDGFAELKEAAKLRVEAANIDHRRRGEINAEIRKLESIKK